MFIYRRDKEGVGLMSTNQVLYNYQKKEQIKKVISFIKNSKMRKKERQKMKYLD